MLPRSSYSMLHHALLYTCYYNLHTKGEETQGRAAFFYGSLLNSKTTASSWNAALSYLFVVCVYVCVFRCRHFLPAFCMCFPALLLSFASCCLPCAARENVLHMQRVQSQPQSGFRYRAPPSSFPFSGWGQSRCGYIKLIFTPTLAATSLWRCSFCHAPAARSLLPQCVCESMCVCVCVSALTCVCSCSTCSAAATWLRHHFRPVPQI